MKLYKKAELHWDVIGKMLIILFVLVIMVLIYLIFKDKIIEVIQKFRGFI